LSKTKRWNQYSNRDCQVWCMARCRTIQHIVDRFRLRKNKPITRFQNGFVGIIGRRKKTKEPINWSTLPGMPNRFVKIQQQQSNSTAATTTFGRWYHKYYTATSSTSTTTTLFVSSTGGLCSNLPNYLDFCFAYYIQLPGHSSKNTFSYLNPRQELLARRLRRRQPERKGPTTDDDNWTTPATIWLPNTKMIKQKNRYHHPSWLFPIGGGPFGHFVCVDNTGGGQGHVIICGPQKVHWRDDDTAKKW
jgi:hypothetical protein